MRDLETLTIGDFAPLQGERCRLGAPGFEAELVEVTEIAREPGGREPFSLVFEGGPTPPLPQGTHRLEHRELGLIEFMAPQCRHALTCG